MRYFLLAFFVFVSQCIFAQKNNADDSNIVATYADTSAVVAAKFVLVKVPAALQKNFIADNKNFISRRINERWFIVQSSAQLSPGIVERKFAANNLWKYSDELLAKRSLLSRGSQHSFLLTIHDTIAFRAFATQHAKDINIISSYAGFVLVRSKASFLENELAPLDYITAVDWRNTKPKEELLLNDYYPYANNLNLLASAYPFANGNNLLVSIKENSFDTTDYDLRGRYVNIGLASASRTAHALIMATIIGGAGNSFYTGKGVAPNTKMSSSDFAVLLPDGNTYSQYGISVQNHSYGVGIENFYGADAAAYDTSMRNNKNLMHVFSAGNSGDSISSTGNYAGIHGFANLTGSFKMAKNVITVGSLDSFYAVPSASSKGPAYDGRIKPDLVAYGNDGSSGAAAITSGTILAMQSAYAHQHAGTLPGNVLVKAVLINSADDVANNGPDYYSGYGNVNAYKAVKDILSEHYFIDSVNNGTTKDFPLSIPSNATNLKITLTWIDVPAATNAFTALVNDLDLSLERNNNAAVWLPWVLNSAANADSLNKIATRKRDSLNVIEQVTIANPAAADYTIHVKGYDVSQGPQTFCVAYRWDTLNTFYFTSPAAKDHFTAAGKNVFRCNSTYPSSATGKLEYSLNNGNTWTLINATLDLDDKYFFWTAPDTTAKALVRMTIGTDVYVSDTFNFSKQLYPSVGFYCADSSLITWNKMPGIQHYQVLKLGNSFLEPLTTTADTSIVLHNSNIPSHVIAVAPQFDDGSNAVASYAFDYTQQGVACYISNFLADLTSNNTAQLHLSLGSTFSVAAITFQSFGLNGWQTLSQSNTPLPENFYTDNALHAGINTYRAAITLQNGATIYSNTATVLYAGNNNFVLLPNPVPLHHDLTLLTNSFETRTVVCYDVMGRKVLQQSINSSENIIPVSRLARGMYFIVVYSGTQKLYSSKFLVE